MNGNIIVIILGIIYSCVLHIARSMQRLGIHSFDRFRQHLTRKAPLLSPAGKHHIYIIGLLLSNLCVVFVILAGKYGTISYFTAMYGIGMLPMLLFTKYVMKERSGVQNWVGVIIVIIGGFIMSLAARNSLPVNYSLVNIKTLLLILLVTGLISPLIIINGKKSGHLFKDAMHVGLIAGLIAALDPILKATGQNLAGANGFIPDNTIGWLLFILSFAASSAAMLITQHAYSRRVFVSQLIPFYNVAYITLPIIIQILILPHYLPGKFEITGLICIITGMVIFSEKDLRLTRNADILKAEKSVESRKNRGIEGVTD
ncbi:MAG: hypothetical protein K9N06_07355 [Candidatus Cloacimonetes bacterium]|nr:hypothetical protein [Candidatus Cloacimonadota bacterium]